MIKAAMLIDGGSIPGRSKFDRCEINFDKPQIVAVAANLLAQVHLNKKNIV